MNDLVHLRKTVTQDQRKILNAIWEHYRNSEEWPFAVVLYSRFGKEVVDAAVKALGSSVVWATSNPTDRKRFGLTFLGMLLTDHGENIEAWLIDYLHYVKDRLTEEPDLRETTSSGFNPIVNFSPTQSQSFYKALAISPFLNGGHHTEGEWAAGLPPWIDDLVSAKDVRAFFQQHVFTNSVLSNSQTRRQSKGKGTVSQPTKISSSGGRMRSPRPHFPVGSPYGFTDQDWEIVVGCKRRKDVLYVVLGYQFRSNYYDPRKLKRNIENMFAKAANMYNNQVGRPSIKTSFRTLAAGYGRHLFNEIARDIISSDIAVFETSDLNLNVMIEMGVALTWGVQVLPIKLRRRPDPPSDISGQTWATYRDNGSDFLDSEHEEKLVAMIERAIRNKQGK